MCQNKLTVKIGERLNPYTGSLYPVYENVSCRKCEECVSIRKSQWCFRALAEAEHSFNSMFLTLTYADEFLPEGGNVRLRDCQLFFKRCRNQIARWYPNFDTKEYPLKYFLVSEYGSKRGRPHYHLILWNCPLTSEEIFLCWKLGFVKVKPCVEPTIQYTLKYFACKDFAPDGKKENFCVMSKNLGKQWLADNLSYVKSFVTMPGSNARIPIPSYYRDRLRDHNPEAYPKREFFWDYRPSQYEKFSRKFLKTRRLATRRCLVDNMDPKSFNVLCHDAENYYLYRDEIFKKRYKSMMARDGQ